MSPPDGADRVGEVVAASTIEFAAQCHRLYQAPPLGALVRCGGDVPIYGIVGEVATQSLDPGRRPRAMASEGGSVEQVYQRNPQLSRLLATEFRSVVVGFQDNGTLRRYLAPLAPMIHAPVFLCPAVEVLEFSAALDFLPVVLAAPFGSPDDTAAAFLRQASVTHPDPGGFLLAAGKELAGLLAGELPRLNGILRRLAP